MRLEKHLNETSAPGGLIGVADIFTRYLLGDTKVAINQLKSLPSQISLDLPELKDASEYNKLYNKVHTAIFQALRKSLK